MFKFFWHFGKTILPDNFGHPIKVEKKFHLWPNILHTPGKYMTLWKFWGTLRTCMLPENLGQIIKVDFFLVAALHFWYVGKKNIRNSCEYKGIFLTLCDQGVKLTSLFHPNLIPNLEKLKIFILGVIPRHLSPLTLMPCYLSNQFLPLCMIEIALGLVYYVNLSLLPPQVWICLLFIVYNFTSVWDQRVH